MCKEIPPPCPGIPRPEFPFVQNTRSEEGMGRERWRKPWGGGGGQVNTGGCCTVVISAWHDGEELLLSP